MKGKLIETLDTLKDIIITNKISDENIVYILNSVEELKKYTQKLLFSNQKEEDIMELIKPKDDFYFLVRFYENETKLMDYLKKNGFEAGKGFGLNNIPVAPWYFISIQQKKYVRGRIGVGFKNIIGNHAVTVKEFLFIYDMYTKYANKKLLEM